MRIEARVYGDPKPQPRPRAFRRGAHAAVFNPATAEGWKSLIAAAIRDQLPPAPYEGAVSVSARFILPRPKRLQRRKDPDGELLHTAKPDGDNLIKAVLDACSQISVWRDDAHVVDLFVQKRYAAKDGRPGLHLIIASIDDDAAAREGNDGLNNDS